MGFYRLNQIRVSLDYKESDIRSWIKRKYGLETKSKYKIVRQSVDARKKEQIKLIFTVDFPASKSDDLRLKNVKYFEKEEVYINKRKREKGLHRPVVVGAGPAGLFAGLILAESGLNPIILEQGVDVDTRKTDIEDFFSNGRLKEESNIQFGEGGAGTFSDGKLSTGVKDKNNRISKIMSTFIEAGAPEEISYNSKPHIGTDYLIKVVKNIRLKIIELGGEIRFKKQVTNLDIKNGKIEGIIINTNEKLKTNHLVMAIGHSARDTFEMLLENNIPMESKSFAVGLRIEHTQEMISKSQFGKMYQHRNLPVAEYKLTYQTSDKRGVYSFCMCPGGFVVNAASELGGVVCNGMSHFARNEKNANSAILVTVRPEDFESTHILAGVDFQRKWEKIAYELGGETYALPVQRLEDFMMDKMTKKSGVIVPNIKGEYIFADLNKALPEWIIIALKKGIINFGKKIKGFDQGDAILTAVETRSSSPVRILRDKYYMSTVEGFYPCGEGAGYAGGIMSAALDGMKVAEAIIE